MKKSLVLLLLSACQASAPVPMMEDAATQSDDGGAPVEQDSGPGPDASQPPGPMPIGLAVVSGDIDYKATSLSLIDPATRTVTKADCLTSGTTAPELSLALSGDVALPSHSFTHNSVVLIDRGNSTLTWVNPASCAPVAQLAVGTGFAANPHDLIEVSAKKLYLTRSDMNAMPSGTMDQGDDILIIDPTSKQITGRIDLHGQADIVNGAPIQARPDRGLQIDGKVYVTLTHASLDFKTFGSGKIVVIDGATDQVTTSIAVDPYKNCSGLDYVPASKTLYVACNGDYSSIDQASQSAIVTIDLSGATPVLGKLTLPSQVALRPLSKDAISADGSRVFSISAGNFGNTTDIVWSYDIGQGKSTKLLTGDDSFILGFTAIDRTRNQLYVTDASANKPVVHVFQLTSGDSQELPALSPSSKMLPRQIGWY